MGREDAQTLKVGKHSLDGAARIWYMAKEELFVNFDEFKKIFKKKFFKEETEDQNQPKEFNFYKKLLTSDGDDIVQTIYELKILGVGVNGALKSTKEWLWKKSPRYLEKEILEIRKWPDLIEWAGCHDNIYKKKEYGRIPIKKEEMSNKNLSRDPASKTKLGPCFNCGDITTGDIVQKKMGLKNTQAKSTH